MDNLHEQAGSTRVLHLHGELMKLRSEENPELIYDINEGWEQSIDERGEDGALLRPHIVFGEKMGRCSRLQVELSNTQIF